METQENQEVFNASFYAEFYTEGLYLLAEDKKGVTLAPDIINKTPVKEALKIQGNPNSESLILLNYAPGTAIPTSDIEYLNKILGSVKLDMQKIALINIGAEKGISPQDIMLLPYKKIIAFDSPMGLLPINLQLYTLSQQGDKLLFLTDRLSDIQGSQPLREKLWGALQQMYLK